MFVAHQVKPPHWIFLRRGKPLMIIWLWVMITDRFNWSSFLTHCGPLDCHYSGFLLVLHFPASQECDQWQCGTGQTQSVSIKIINRSKHTTSWKDGEREREREWNEWMPEKTEIYKIYTFTLLFMERIEVWKTNPNHRLLVFPSIYIHFIWYFYRFHICNIFKTFSSSRFLHCALHLQIEYWNPAILTRHSSSWRVPTGPNAVVRGGGGHWVDHKYVGVVGRTVVQFEVTDSPQT